MSGVQVRVGEAFTRTFPDPYEATAWALKVEHVLGCDADDIEIDDHRPVYTVEDCRPIQGCIDRRSLMGRMDECLRRNFAPVVNAHIAAHINTLLWGHSHQLLWVDGQDLALDYDAWLAACPALTRREKIVRRLRRARHRVAKPLREARARVRLAWNAIRHGDQSRVVWYGDWK